jgi:outer membrane protein, heavy metal efflux system
MRPDSQLESFNRRRLDDPGLLAWFDSVGVARPAGAWTPRQLALAASWFRPERQSRLAAVSEADAALTTAGARPQPGVSSDLEYAFSDPQSSSRWGIALAGLFTLELGGKRGARVARALAGALAARAAAGESEWQQAGRIYGAFFGWYRANRRSEVVREERAGLDTVFELVQARYDEGTLTRLELARAEGERRAAVAAEHAAEREEHLARVALASETAVSTGVIDGAELATTPWPSCHGEADPRDSLQRVALGTRWSVRRAAADYQVAEGNLRIAVANAAPDLTLGPGMFFDQGTGKFTLAAALPSIPLNRNRGPIAEADARRRLAGARLAEAQELLLTEVEAALAGCEAASREAGAADSLAAETARRGRLVDAAYARGETGRLEVALAGIELTRVRGIVVEAELRRMEAELALDRALGAWGLRRDGPWPDKALPGAARRMER